MQWTETLKIKGPYDFDLGLHRLSLDPLNKINIIDRMIHIPIYKTNEVASIKAIGTVDEPAFEVSGQDEITKVIVLKEVERIFRWDVSLEDMHTFFLHTALAPIFNQHIGTPLILEFSLYACLCRSIIHQQLNLSFARTLTERFVMTYGYQKSGVWFFPSPGIISELPVEALRALQFSQRKAEYIIDLAKVISDRMLDIEALTQEDDETVVKELVKLRGIGPWTAQSFLLFGLGRENLFPVADVGLQQAIKKIHGLSEKPTAAEMLEISEVFSPYASYASLYLWRSIEVVE